MSEDIVKRLKAMHDDLKQGTIFSEWVDPDWDVTLLAADEINRLRKIVIIMSETMAEDT